LDTRTKHIVAQDRLVVAEKRTLDVERRKSASHLQLLAIEQKQAEKKLSSYRNLDKHHRSISEANLQHIHQLNELSQSKFNQTLLSLPKFDPFSVYSDEDTSESSEDDDSKTIKKKKLRPPVVTIIPPEEDDFNF
jgi:hypothetical protein